MCASEFIVLCVLDTHFFLFLKIKITLHITSLNSLCNSKPSTPSVMFHTRVFLSLSLPPLSSGTSVSIKFVIFYVYIFWSDFKNFFLETSIIFLHLKAQSLEPNNTKPDPPFLLVKVFVINPNNITLLSDISNVIVFMLSVLMIHCNGPLCVNWPDCTINSEICWNRNFNCHLCSSKHVCGSFKLIIESKYILVFSSNNRCCLETGKEVKWKK